MFAVPKANQPAAIKRRKPPTNACNIFNSPRAKLSRGKRRIGISMDAIPLAPAAKVAKLQPPTPKVLHQPRTTKVVESQPTTKPSPASNHKKTTCLPLNATFNQLSHELQEYIVDYLEDHIPTMGALACVSKNLQEITYQDARWESHLRILQTRLFQGNTRIRGEAIAVAVADLPKVLPLSQRPLKSTQFLPWYDQQEKRMEAADTRQYRETTPLLVALQHANRVFQPDQDPWLYKDIGLRDYYQRLGQLGFWAEVCCQSYCFEHSQCYGCFDLLQFGRESPGVYCHRCGVDSLANIRIHLWTNILNQLPSIQLFRTLPRWTKAKHQQCWTALKDKSVEEYAAWVRENHERFG